MTDDYKAVLPVLEQRVILASLRMRRNARRRDSSERWSVTAEILLEQWCEDVDALLTAMGEPS